MAARRQAATALRSTRLSPELSLHMDVAEFLTLALKPPTWWSTFPAGGGGKVRGALLKACGLRAGTPDLLVVHESRTLFIELKSAQGRLSYDQSFCIASLREAGAYVAVCRSVEAVEDFLRKGGIPLHASVMARAA